MGAGTLTALSKNQEAEDYFSYGARKHRTLPNDSVRQQNITPPRFYSTGADDNPNLRGGSAKRLISQYEKLGTPPARSSRSGIDSEVMKANLKSTKRVQYVRGYRTGSGSLQTGYAVGGASKKEKSPITQSLRNLLSVLKKGAGGLKKKGEDEFGELSHAHGDALGTLQKRQKRMVDGPSTIHLNLAERAKTLPSPPKTTTGSLFYLTRILPPEELVLCAKNPTMDNLAWTSCTVTLEATSYKLHLSSFISELQYVLHEISLSGCADVRSLSASQLSEKEAKLLDEVSVRSVGELGKLKAFEMSFVDGRSKERFAAKSVKERAGWISAIWDVILPDGVEMNVRVLQTPISPFTSQTTHQGQFSPIESPTPVPLPCMSSLLSSSPSQRSLPPIPSEATTTAVKRTSKKPMNLHLDIPHANAALSPSIYPTTPIVSPIREPRPLLLNASTATAIRPTPLTASTYPTAASRPPSILSSTSTPLASPSIINLGQLSMVRQRLAQIERNHSQLSRSGYSEAVVRPSTPMTPIARTGKRRSINTPSKGGSLATTRESSASKPSDTGTSIETFEMMSRTPSADTNKNTPSLKRRDSRQPEEENVETSYVSKKDSEQPQAKREDKNPSKRYLTTEDIEDLSKQIGGVKGVLGGESGHPTIHQVVIGLEDRTRDNKRILKTIQERIDELGGRLTDVQSSATALSSTVNEIRLRKDNRGDETQEPVLRAIENVKARLISEFPSIGDKVQELQSVQARLLERIQDKEREHVYSNAPPATSQNELELKPVIDKLDELMVLFQASQKGSGETGVSKEGSQILENVEKVLSIVQQESSKQVMFSQQQAESVRYLNELNNWLETFVNNGTSQIQGLSMNIEHLCRALGCDSRSSNVPGAGFKGATPNLLSDIRQLVSGMQARDQNFAALQAAVHSLLEVLSSSQAQMGAESQAIAGLITRQRQEQEVLLRTFTSEISGEIKGERLRFVEAMKEATAINVQLHVEHFKQDLSREVMAMTEEVGRLHREKQIIENQISDLFAFYSKHKKSTSSNYGDTHAEAIHSVQGRPRADIPRSHPRPLPYPGAN